MNIKYDIELPSNLFTKKDLKRNDCFNGFVHWLVCNDHKVSIIKEGTITIDGKSICDERKAISVYIDMIIEYQEYVDNIYT